MLIDVAMLNAQDEMHGGHVAGHAKFDAHITACQVSGVFKSLSVVRPPGFKTEIIMKIISTNLFLR